MGFWILLDHDEVLDFQLPLVFFDPLVITINRTYEVQKVLIDNGSSPDLLYLSTLLDVGIDPKDIFHKK